MTGKETLEKAVDRAHDAAESMGEAVNEAAKGVNEVAKEQWSKITQEAAEIFGEDNGIGNLFCGVLVAVSSTFFVYGICEAFNYFKKPEN